MTSASGTDPPKGYGCFSQFESYDAHCEGLVTAAIAPYAKRASTMWKGEGCTRNFPWLLNLSPASVQYLVSLRRHRPNPYDYWQCWHLRPRRLLCTLCSTTRSPSSCCLIRVPRILFPDITQRLGISPEPSAPRSSIVTAEARQGSAHPTGLPGRWGGRCGGSASGGVYRAPTCSLHR